MTFQFDILFMLFMVDLDQLSFILLCRLEIYFIYLSDKVETGQNFTMNRGGIPFLIVVGAGAFSRFIRLKTT